MYDLHLKAMGKYNINKETMAHQGQIMLVECTHVTCNRKKNQAATYVRFF